jgi:membrane protease YdiL (CAAX protease family)
MKSVLKKALYILLLAVILLAVPRLSGVIADLFNYSAIDPDGSYAWITMHHLVQTFIFLLIIALINRFKPLNYGFTWGNKDVGRKYVLSFALIFTAGSFVSHIITLLAGSFQPFQYPLTSLNIFGQLGFQLLLSGPSEELIFRAFAITMLVPVIRGRFLKGKVSYANLIAALIFGLAHVKFSFAPFAVDYTLYQVLMSVILGLFYGDCYEKTGSVYYPMIMHSVSNIVMVSMTVIASLLLSY